MVGGQWSLSVQSGRMRNWIFLPCTLSCVFSLQLLGESLTTRRRGRAAQYWNLTGSGQTTRSTREVQQFRSLGQSFPLALPSGSLFSVSILPPVRPKNFSFQLFFEIAINVFNYNEEVSQGILLDFPITYQIPTPGSRSFSTSRGDLINKLEEIGDRWVEKPFKECRQ